MSTDTLICIPCFNSENTIESVLRPLLQHSNADILLIDDKSDVPLAPRVNAAFKEDVNRISVIRPERKVYSGGGKNLGIQRALVDGYAYALLMDSDIIAPSGLIESVRAYFEQHPADVVVSPAILPSGTVWQFTDTLINFSNFLPDPSSQVSHRLTLAGYAFALNMKVFSRRPCFHEARYGGEDVLLFQQLARDFDVSGFPILNDVPVVHLPPRADRASALNAQQRYGRAFFTHCHLQRCAWFHRCPCLHYLTPRFVLMVARLLRRQRWADLRFLPHCWRLDFARAGHIVHLYAEGYEDPALTNVT